MNFEKQDSWKTEHRMEKALEGRFLLMIGNLGLSIDDLKDKKILDIGAGRREFAAHCLKAGISSEVYSAEPNIDEEKNKDIYISQYWPEIIKEIDKKTVKDKRINLSSFDNETFDLVINHAAMPGFGNTLRAGDMEKVRQNVGKIFDEIVRVLRPGGEARIYPSEITTELDTAETRELFKPREEEVSRKLKELVRNNMCTVRFEEFKQNYLQIKNGEKLRIQLSRRRIIIKKK